MMCKKSYDQKKEEIHISLRFFWVFFGKIEFNIGLLLSIHTVHERSQGMEGSVSHIYI